MDTYLVGGAVRDLLLDLPVRERDWVVVGAREETLLKQGYRRVGKDFPVFLHPRSREQYALARRESKVAPGHQGFTFDTGCQVSLAEDLRRRDLTVNAMAMDSDGTLIDPYGGRQDLAARVLRHVSEAFVEDPLRVLRVARFAARFAHLGFTVAAETMALMRRISAGGELATLAGERVWMEIKLAIETRRPQVFVLVLRDCGALRALLPEIDRLFGIPQPARHHPEIDTGEHLLLCLEQAARLTDDPVTRYAVLTHDLGKGLTDPERWPRHHAHEFLGLRALREMHRRIPVPKEYDRLAARVCEHHTLLHRVFELRSRTVLRLLRSLDAWRQPRQFERFLVACEADARGRAGLEDRDYPQADYLRRLAAASADIDVRGLIAAHPGRNVEQLVEQARLERIAAARQATGHPS